ADRPPAAFPSAWPWLRARTGYQARLPEIPLCGLFSCDEIRQWQKRRLRLRGYGGQLIVQTARERTNRGELSGERLWQIVGPTASETRGRRLPPVIRDPLNKACAS